MTVSTAQQWTRTDERSEDSLDLVTELAQYLFECEDLLTSLPSILAFLGQHLDACRITLTFDGEHETREFSWINNHNPEAPGITPLRYQLRRSGSNNYITFHFDSECEDCDTLLTLITTLLDSSLALNGTIRLEHSQRQLAESINHISTILTSTLDREELLSLFLDQLETLVPYDSATVMLLEDGLMYMHAARGFDEITGPVELGEISFVPSETFMMEEVLNGTEPVILEDTRQCPEWVWSPCGKHIRSWMGVPLQVKGNLIGLFSIDKSTPNFFTEKHARMASVLATHASLALDNALLFTQVQQAHEQLRGLSAKIIEVQEKERQKIAMEQHDESGQALLALRAELKVLQHYLNQHPEQALDQIEYLDRIVLDLSRDLAQLACDLRPPTLSTLGLVSALDQYIAEFGQRMKIEADFLVQDLDEIRIPEEIELVCYRIVQEALTNLVKHSHADTVTVRLDCSERKIHLRVKDNGIGFARMKPGQRHGFGLLGIRERLAHINGTLQIKSKPGEGAELIVSIPLKEKT